MEALTSEKPLECAIAGPLAASAISGLASGMTYIVNITCPPSLMAHLAEALTIRISVRIALGIRTPHLLSQLRVTARTFRAKAPQGAKLLMALDDASS